MSFVSDNSSSSSVGFALYLFFNIFLVNIPALTSPVINGALLPLKCFFSQFHTCYQYVLVYINIYTFGRAIWDKLPECIFENFEIARVKGGQFQNF